MRFILSFIFICSCSQIKTITQESSKSTPVEKEQTHPSHLSADGSYKVFTKPNSKKVKEYCDKTQAKFDRYNWGESHCHDYSWHHVRNSYWGNPIVWFVFGDENRLKTQKDLNTTMILCGVHGDEITPVKFCFDILEDLRKNPEIIGDSLVVVAPIVSPDSFFRSRPTRTNARGVDVNRNFPTKDWAKNAKRLWKQRYKQDKRRYPGRYALSEQETIFQVNLINLYKPNKIISVHAPLTLLDYDGPAFSHVHGKSAKQLLIQMSQKANKYKISNYPFFTGSLGNWAGNERNIPTFTLELPNSDWNKTKKYFDMFKLAIREAINHDIAAPDPTRKKVSENKSLNE
jgi:protein MpaA